MEEIILKAYGIVDKLIQNKTIRYHEQITDFKHDLAMDGYTLWLEDRSKTLEACVRKVYKDRLNALRQRGSRASAVVLPFSSVSPQEMEAGKQIPENVSNLEMYDQWFQRFQEYKHILSDGEQDMICMLFDGMTINEVCTTMGISSATVYRALNVIKKKVEDEKENVS